MLPSATSGTAELSSPDPLVSPWPDPSVSLSVLTREGGLGVGTLRGFSGAWVRAIELSPGAAWVMGKAILQV